MAGKRLGSLTHECFSCPKSPLQPLSSCFVLYNLILHGQNGRTSQREIERLREQASVCVCVCVCVCASVSERERKESLLRFIVYKVHERSIHSGRKRLNLDKTRPPQVVPALVSATSPLPGRGGTDAKRGALRAGRPSTNETSSPMKETAIRSEFERRAFFFFFNAPILRQTRYTKNVFISGE